MKNRINLENEIYEIIDKKENHHYCYLTVLNNNKKYFIKQLKDKKDKYLKSLNNEIDFLNIYKSNNICKMYKYKKDEYIIYEYIEGITLEYYDIKDIKSSLMLIIKLCNILNGIHNIGYSHNDLKRNNIIVDNNKITLIDFGNCSKYGSIVDFLNLSTSSYEIRNQKEVDNRSDIYSLGIILYQSITKDEERQEKYTITKEIDGLDEINNIIKKCTDKDKNNRYSNVLELKNELLEVIKKYY